MVHPNILDFQFINLNFHGNHVNIKEDNKFFSTKHQNQDDLHNQNEINIQNEANNQENMNHPHEHFEHALLFLTRYEIGIKFQDGSLIHRNDRNIWKENATSNTHQSTMNIIPDNKEEGNSTSKEDFTKNLQSISNPWSAFEIIENCDLLQQLLVVENKVLITSETGVKIFSLILKDETTRNNNEGFENERNINGYNNESNNGNNMEMHMKKDTMSQCCIAFKNGSVQILEWRLDHEIKFSYPLVRIAKYRNYVILAGEKFVVYDYSKHDISIEWSIEDLQSQSKIVNQSGSGNTSNQFLQNNLYSNKNQESVSNYKYIQSMDLDCNHDSITIALGTNEGCIYVVVWDHLDKFIHDMKQKEVQTQNTEYLLKFQSVSIPASVMESKNGGNISQILPPLGEGTNFAITSVIVKDGWLACGSDLGYGLVYRLGIENHCHSFISNFPITNLEFTTRKEIICVGFSDEIVFFQLNGKILNQVHSSLSSIFKVKCMYGDNSLMRIAVAGAQGVEVLNSGASNMFIEI